MKCYLMLEDALDLAGRHGGGASRSKRKPDFTSNNSSSLRFAKCIKHDNDISHVEFTLLPAINGLLSHASNV